MTDNKNTEEEKKVSKIFVRGKAEREEVELAKSKYIEEKERNFESLAR